MGLELILPPSAQEARKALVCTICGAAFPFQREVFGRFSRHVRKCAERHDDEIQERIAAEQKDYIRNVADKELAEHFAKGGK